MTKIAIPPDLAAMFAACEDAYEQATRETTFGLAPFLYKAQLHKCNFEGANLP